MPKTWKMGRAPETDLASLLEPLEPGLGLLDLLAEVGVGEHAALGDARRAARVLVHGHVLEADLRPRRVGAVFGDAVLPLVDIGRRLHVGGHLLLFGHQREEQALREGQVVADGGVDDLLDLGLRPQVDHAVAQQVERDEDLGARVVELVLQLAIRVQRVVEHRDRPDAKRRVVGDHLRDHVGKKDRHGVALLDPEIGQARGKAVHHVLHLAVRDRVALEDQGGHFRVLSRRPVQDVGHGDLFIVDRGRHPRLVGLEPGLLEIDGVFVGHGAPHIKWLRAVRQQEIILNKA